MQQVFYTIYKDKEYIYIKKYIPELKDISNKDIEKKVMSIILCIIIMPLKYKEACKEILAMLANL